MRFTLIVKPKEQDYIQWCGEYVTVEEAEAAANEDAEVRLEWPSGFWDGQKKVEHIVREEGFPDYIEVYIIVRHIFRDS